MSKLSDAVKKINARLEVFEKRGLTGTWEYNELKKKVATAAGENFRLDARGHFHLSGAGLSPTAKAQIMKTSQQKTTTYTHAKNRLLKEYADYIGPDNKRTVSARVQEAAQYERDIHQFIIEHAADIYKIAYFTMMVRRSERLTPDKARELLDMYNSPEWQQHLELTSISDYKQSGAAISENDRYIMDMIDDYESTRSDVQEAVLNGEMDEGEGRKRVQELTDAIESYIQQLSAMVPVRHTR